ncbi:MAG: mechanosensitive ion channel family protein [Chloroflexota bacterium]|nr:mechanosensitive ion channel family protein [Chloroflexota bacterium]
MEPVTSPLPTASPVPTPSVQTAVSSLEGLINNFIARLPYIVIAVVVLLVSYLLAKGVRQLVRRVSERSKRHRNLGLVLGRLAQFTIVLLGLLIALVIALPGFTPGRLVELLGLTSVAIGFAFRDILQNFLAGILILLTEPFRIGDQIVFKAFEGTVEDIQTRATLIKTYDGRRVVIPNSELFTNAVTVNTAFEHRRLEYDVGIGYGDDIETAKRLMLEAVRSVHGVLLEPAPDVLVVALAESSVTIRVRWWIAPPRRADALDAQDQVIVAVKQTLLANGIDLPFPTRQILFHDQTEATDGDRARQREGWPAGPGDVPPSHTIADALRRLAAEGSSSNDNNGA